MRRYSRGRCPFVPSQLIAGHSLERAVGYAKDTHTYSSVGASDMLRRMWVASCGTRVQQSQLHRTYRTCGPSAVHIFRPCPLYWHAVVPVEFPREVSHCPRGLLLSTSPSLRGNLISADTAHPLHPGTDFLCLLSPFSKIHQYFVWQLRWCSLSIQNIFYLRL